MNHVIPPGTVLVERDPVKAAALIANNPDYVADGQQDASIPWKYTKLTRSKQLLSNTLVAVYWPRTYREYVAAVEPASGIVQQAIAQYQAIAFMGARCSPAGNHRLVVVPSAEVNYLRPVPDFANSTEVHIPVSRWGSLLDKLAGRFSFRSGQYVEARLNPGVADPVDRSHISIPFSTVNHQRDITGTYDLYLQDDDTIRVVVNETPAKAP